jgi:hypothetical protein
MPLSTDSLIQQQTGSFESTSGSASVPVNVTSGNAVLIVAALGGDGSGTFNISTPSGFSSVAAPSSGIRHGKAYCFLKQVSAGSESSWTLTVTGGSQQVCWAAFEMVGADMVDVLTVGEAVGVYLEAGNQPIGDSSLVSSRDTTATATSASYNVLALAMFAFTSNDTADPVVSGYTNGFGEITTVGQANGTRAQRLAVAAKVSQSLETFSTVASVSPSSYAYSILVVFTAADIRHAPNLDTCSGFEVGTVTGLATTSAEAGVDCPPPFDASTGSPAIVATSARTGNWCLELSAIVAVENVSWTAPASPAAKGNLNRVFGGNGCPVGVFRLHFYFPTALPLVDVELVSLEAGSAANGVVVRFVSSSSKIGVKIGSGTEQLSSTTVSASQWIGLDLYYDPRTTTHTCDWQLDYTDSGIAVAQTQASTTSMTAALINAMYLGWTAARTATVRYDDVVFSRWRKSYPIGPVNIRPLKVDPAGTPTISGTSANFNVFTSNGTMSAWNATNARNALDDVPPSIGATSDGVAQITVASSDYMEVAMETYDPVGLHSHRAARWYWCGWANSGNPATCQFRVGDTTAPLTTFGFIADHGFDNAALVWMGGMHRDGTTAYYLLTQAKVDALRFQWGFSDDANPDVGIHCALVELVTAPVVVKSVIEEEAGAYSVYVREDPLTQAAVSYLVTTPVAGGATFTATINGSDYTQHVNAGTTGEKVVGAVDIGEVTNTGLIPDSI